MMSRKVLTGSATPLGATAGTNFAVSSGGDEVTLCLFDRDGTETQLVLPDRDGDVWHRFVPGVRAGSNRTTSQGPASTYAVGVAVCGFRTCE